MMICVPTIMHSGTHTLRYEILKEEGDGKNKDNWNFMGSGPSARDCEVSTILGGHLNNSMMDKWEDAFKEFPVFTCLRHPVRIAETFRRRGKCIRHLNEMWMNMIEVVDKYDPFYIHVDDKQVRDAQVKLMGEILGLPLKTNWPINKDTNSITGTHDFDISDTKDVPQEFIDFYYEKRYATENLQSKRA